MTAAAAVPSPPRLTRAPGRRAAVDPTPPGLLVAVCATSSGAGASTLTRLLALAAAGRSDGPVLLCRQPGPVTRAWAELTPGQRLGELFVRPQAEQERRQQPERLRVLAVPAQPTAHDVARFGLRLARARARYSLTVVDCATLGASGERIALTHASHLVWVLRASGDGLEHARRALAAVRPPAAARELLVARHDGSDAPTVLPALRRLAGARPAPLVLAPRLKPGLSDRAALERSQVTLQALLGALAR